jgi:hypothetical protein
MSELRIALTLPGEASLGAFQAGAVSALIVAIERINCERPPESPVRLDVMTGSSSGSLTAVLAAHALLTGGDPVDPLRRAWVVEPTVDALRGQDGRAPLTLDRAREVASELLSDAPPDPLPKAAQAEEILANFALTSLRGFTYEIKPPRSEVTLPKHRAGLTGIVRREQEPRRATSHLDWAEHRLEPKTDWPDVVDSAIASASHPAAFPPTLLDRGDLEGAYKRNGVDPFPDCPVLWYADGGLLDREPVGRCINLARRVDEGSDEHLRVLLLLRPEPDVKLANDDPAWTEADGEPSWTATLARALRIVVTHSLYEDLRRVERVNSRIAWLQLVAEGLADICDEAKAKKALPALIERIRAEKGELRAGERGREEPLQRTIVDLLGQLLAEATGLAGKQQIALEVVSAPSAADVAGGSLLNFGGFLAERLRANDFLVGYMAMLTWMRSWPYGHFEDGLDEAEERAATIPGWIGGVAGQQPLSWRARVDVLRLAARAARIGLRRRGAASRV